MFQTTTADVRTVLVGGRVIKRDGVLVGTDLAVLTSADDTAAEGVLSPVRDAGVTLPGTPPGARAALEPLVERFHAEAQPSAQA